MSRIPSQRSLFDIPEGIAYFNCAYHGPQLNASREALIAGLQQNSHPWERTPISFFEDAETLRRLAAELYGGDADGYAVVPAVSYGMSTVARIMEPRLRRGDTVLLIADDFPSNVLPWRRIAREVGVELRTVAHPADGDWTRAIVSAIDRSVKIVSAATCHWTNGARIDLLPIRAACRAVDAVLAVDATQTLGAMPLSIDTIQPDFLVAASYKWQLGPYGCGLFYISERWRDARPLEESWLARTNAEDFTSLADYSDAYMAGARRFDVGEKGSRTVLPGTIAALKQIKAWGIENISESIGWINSDLSDFLRELGFQVPDAERRCRHLLGARLPKGYEGNLTGELKTRGIYISQRGSSLRFAPHLHIADRDVDRLKNALRELIR
jgi:selenocysteine lyase/cysteine desulfurase